MSYLEELQFVALLVALLMSVFTMILSAMFCTPFTGDTMLNWRPADCLGLAYSRPVGRDRCTCNNERECSRADNASNSSSALIFFGHRVQTRVDRFISLVVRLAASICCTGGCLNATKE
jgi:hypothetical protein